MKLDYLKNKNKLVPTVLLGISVLCGILIIVKATGLFIASAKAESVVKQAIEQSKPDPNNVKNQLASSEKIAADLKRNNLFAPPEAKKHPVEAVLGIFGDQVLIKDKWYNIGDAIGEAKIVAIGPTSVTISWDGREKAFLPIQAVVAEASGGQRGRTSGAKENEESGKDQKREGDPEAVTVRIEGGRPEFGGRGGPGGAGFMAMRQRFENMSDEERQAAIARMRERFAGGRGGGRDFGGRGGPGGGRGPGGRR
jgi:hypothetical protein